LNDVGGCFQACGGPALLCGPGPAPPAILPIPFVNRPDPDCPLGYAPSPGLRNIDGRKRVSQKNVVLIVLDDQDEIISPYFDAMPFSREFFLENGTRFENAYTSTSICCASRCQLLTGLLGHNVGVLQNVGTYGGLSAFKKPRDQQGGRIKDQYGRCINFEDRSLSVFLKSAGYATGIWGKYLNGIENDTTNSFSLPPSPGWDEFTVGANRQFYTGYNYVLGTSNRGGPVSYQWHAANPADYLTDVIRDKALNFVASQRQPGHPTQPLFMMLNPAAPHFPCPAARRHTQYNSYWASRYDSIVTSRPNYNADDSDKSYWLRTSQNVRGAYLTTSTWNKVDFIKRMGSLYAIDEMIAALVNQFKALGELDKTVFILTSDNGYNLGAHKLIHKMAAYEESIRVPLFFAGGGVGKGATVKDRTVLVDLAPTILDFANMRAPSYMDGFSLSQKLFVNPHAGHKRQAVYVQYKNHLPGAAPDVSQIGVETSVLVQGLAPPPFFLDVEPYKGVRTSRYLFLEVTNVLANTTAFKEYEAYDMKTDPYQLHNIYNSLDVATKTELQNLLQTLANCTGSECWDIDENDDDDEGSDD